MAPLQEDLGILIILKGYQNCQLSIVNCQFGEAAKQQFTALGWGLTIGAGWGIIDGG